MLIDTAAVVAAVAVAVSSGPAMDVNFVNA